MWRGKHEQNRQKHLRKIKGKGNENKRYKV